MTTGITISSDGKWLKNGDPWLPIGWNSVASLHIQHKPQAPRAYSSKIQYKAAWEHFTASGSPTCQDMLTYGTNVVRLQLVQNILANTAYISGTSGPTFSSAYIAQTQTLVDIAEAAGMAVILCPNSNIHGAAAGPHKKVIDANLYTAWAQLAPVFADDQFVMYELINEPAWAGQIDAAHHLDKDHWSMFATAYQSLITAVRADAPNNVIIVEGAGVDSWHGSSTTWEGWLGTHDDFAALPNIGYAVHKYETPENIDKWFKTFGDMAMTGRATIFTEWYENPLYNPAHTSVKQHLQHESLFLDYCAANGIGVLGWVFDHFTDPVQSNGLLGSQFYTDRSGNNGGAVVDAAGKTSNYVAGKPWTFHPTKCGQMFKAWANHTPYIDNEPQTFWDVQIFKNDLKIPDSTWPLVVTQVNSISGSEALGTVRTFTLTLNVADIHTIPANMNTVDNEGMFVEIRAGLTDQKLIASGYVSKVSKAFPTLTLEIQGAEIVLTEFRSADAQTMNWPQYCHATGDNRAIMSVLNGRYNHKHKRWNDDPGYYGVNPHRWFGHWVDAFTHLPPPGKGTSWEVDLDTPMNSILGLAAIFNCHVRFRDNTTRKAGHYDFGMLGEESGVTIWGGDALKDVLNDTRWQWDLPSAALAQNLGLVVIQSVQFQDTYDGMYNLIAVPGAGTGDTQITLASFWGADPDEIGTEWLLPGGRQMGHRRYWLGPQKSHWSKHVYRHVAWLRQGGGWEYGICDQTSCEQYGIREGPPYQYGTKRITNRDALLEAGMGLLDYNSSPVPSITYSCLHPRTSDSTLPTMVKPGQRLIAHYRGQVPVINDANTKVASKWLDTDTMPEMSDPGKKRCLTTVVQVDWTWDASGFKVNYTMGHGKWRRKHWQHAASRELEHTARIPTKNHKMVETGYLDNVPFLFSAMPNAWQFGNYGVMSVGAMIVSDGPHNDTFFGEGHAVEFDCYIWHDHQQLRFWFCRPWHLPSLWPDCSAMADNAKKGTWKTYALLNLAMPHSTHKSGIYTTQNGVALTKHALMNRKGFIWKPGGYHVKLAFHRNESADNKHKNLFIAHVTAKSQKDHHTGKHPVIKCQWYDVNAGAPWFGQIGWQLVGGVGTARIHNLNVTDIPRT